MTLSQFNQLTPEEQDAFSESDGIISPEPSVGDSSGVVVPGGVSSSENRQPVKGIVPPVSKGGSPLLPPDEQAAPTFVPRDEYKDGFDIQDPVELLFLVDDDIIRGSKGGGTDLHPWQVQFMVDFADTRHCKDFPMQAEVCAANGSGKDKYIIAACAVWLCMRYREAFVSATNGSGDQLDSQTCLHIEKLANKVNRKFGTVWKCNYRYFQCLETSSIINLFATDEPNKAEGNHPTEAGNKFAIFASEAKAIPDEIFGALERCHGFTHKIDVSSPGLPMGHFHDMWQGAIERKTITDIKSIGPTDILKYTITAYDCPHITQNEIDRIIRNTPGGINSPLVRSSIFAEFGTTDEMVVIPYTYIWKAQEQPNQPSIVWIKEDFNKAGLDLSDGGDETVLTIRNGNKHLATIPFKFDNTEDTVSFLDEKFKEWDLDHAECIINADCGGLGKPILDRMFRMGWRNIRYIDNRSKARYPKTYLNRGTELWFNVRYLFEQRELILQRETTLVRQLSTRYYKITNTNVHQLLSKVESRSRGYPSPDRADSFVLAFWDYKSTTDNSYKEPTKVPFALQKAEPIKQSFSLKQWASAKSTQGNLGEMWNINNRQKDFSILQEELAERNQLLLQQKNKELV